MIYNHTSFYCVNMENKFLPMQLAFIVIDLNVSLYIKSPTLKFY